MVDDGGFSVNVDGSGKPLSSREIRFAHALAEGLTVADSARAAGISLRTAARWRARPTIASAVRERSRELVGDAATVLAAGATRASRALVGMAEGTPAPSSAQVAAARAVVGLAVELTALGDIERRLAAIEARGGNGS